MIGEKLLDLRKDAGLTQCQLGEIININKHSISSYERNKSEPPDEIKNRIAKYFGVSVYYLLDVTDSPNPYAKELNCFRLPAKFPAKANDDLNDYIKFLIQKYNKGFE